MRIIVLVFVSVFFSVSAFAIEIASCSNPEGKSYFPYLGMVSKDKAGWRDNGIDGGIVKLKKNDKDEFDILFVDSAKRIISSRDDGGQVVMLNKGENEASFFVYYPGQTVEIFTFLTNNDGKNEYIHMTSRGGDQAMITKSSIFVGECDYIHYNLID